GASRLPGVRAFFGGQRIPRAPWAGADRLVAAAPGDAGVLSARGPRIPGTGEASDGKSASPAGPHPVLRTTFHPGGHVVPQAGEGAAGLSLLPHAGEQCAGLSLLPLAGEQCAGLSLLPLAGEGARRADEGKPQNQNRTPATTRVSRDASPPAAWKSAVRPNVRSCETPI